MEHDPLVSIITPTYNISHIIDETIKSVVDQSYKNWELILIDDASNDDTAIHIKKWMKEDDRVKALFLKTNVGAGVARNIGLQNVSGEYVAFLDGDDLWIEDKLSKQIRFFESNRDIDFLYSWYITINERGEKQSRFVAPKFISKEMLRFNNYILTSTVIIRWKDLKNVRFPEIRKRQDWAYFLDLLTVTGKAYALQDETVLYRKMANTLSANRWKLIKPNFLFFRDYLYKGNSVVAILHFLIFLPFYFHNKIFNKKALNN